MTPRTFAPWRTVGVARSGWLGVVVAIGLVGLVACAGPTVRQGASVDGDGATDLAANRSSAEERATRRLFDGAPPVIPHDPFGAACTACHHRQGLAVPDVGFAPPSPHGEEALAGSLQRCQQCHVFQQADAPWVGSTFAGLRQDLRRGRRFASGAPPVMPHRSFMREHCAACHTGPAAREEIRTSHPERSNCRQCHVEQTTSRRFPASGP